MEELLDILDENTGIKTGEIVSKKIAHKNGKWHGSIHVLIINKDKSKTLLQKRSKEKKLYPDTWDISVGGHISAGEDDITSAIRELNEELGLLVNKDKLIKVDRIKEQLNNNGVISNEYVSIFLLYDDININNIKLQASEVSNIKWCSKEELNNFINNNVIIPHVREYEILNDILID